MVRETPNYIYFVRERTREVCDIPVIFITAYTDPDTVERIHEEVPDAPVIAKPRYRERLASAVAEVGAS